jgi:hypothetical protein
MTLQFGIGEIGDQHLLANRGPRHFGAESDDKQHVEILG